MSKPTEFRCPVHGFIRVDPWERAIIDHPAFQRLRRIRQLAWTDQVYPGAMHTRFEHSLGVMHVATKLFERVVHRSGEMLVSDHQFNKDGFGRDKVLVRLAALLHDVGHGPFSHAGEHLLPVNPKTNKQYRHEDYSAAIIREQMRDVIECKDQKDNYGWTADDVAALIAGTSGVPRQVFWQELISGQMDADRMDYLLRDSLHAGVDYGKYDWRRLVNSVVAVAQEGRGSDAGSARLRLGVTEGGLHAAEGLILARYFMFNQVYFHKTRVAYNHHLHQALKELLPGGAFPPPLGDGLKDFTAWDDWKVLGLIGARQGGDHGRRLRERDHYRQVYQTPERPGRADLKQLREVRKLLKGETIHEDSAVKSWYNPDGEDIPVQFGSGVRPLSQVSGMIGKLEKSGRVRLFAPPERARVLRDKVDKLVDGES